MTFQGFQIPWTGVNAMFLDYGVPAATFLAGLLVRTFFDRRTARIVEELKSSLKTREADEQSTRDQLANVYKHLIEKTAQRGSDLEVKKTLAIEQCWDAVLQMAPFRGMAAMTAGFKMRKFVEGAAEKTTNGEKLRNLAKMFIDSNPKATAQMEGGGPNNNLHLVRLYLQDDIYKLISTYRLLCIRPYSLMRLASMGESASLLKSPEEYAPELKIALPDYASYIDEFGEDGFSYLYDALEQVILNRLRSLMGVNPLHDVALVRQIDTIMNEYRSGKEIQVGTSAPPGLENRTPPPTSAISDYGFQAGSQSTG